MIPINVSICRDMSELAKLYDSKILDKTDEIGIQSVSGTAKGAKK